MSTQLRRQIGGLLIVLVLAVLALTASACGVDQAQEQQAQQQDATATAQDNQQTQTAQSQSTQQEATVEARARKGRLEAEATATADASWSKDYPYTKIADIASLGDGQLVRTVGLISDLGGTSPYIKVTQDGAEITVAVPTHTDKLKLNGYDAVEIFGLTGTAPDGSVGVAAAKLIDDTTGYTVEI